MNTALRRRNSEISDSVDLEICTHVSVKRSLFLQDETCTEKFTRMYGALYRKRKFIFVVNCVFCITV